MLSRCGLLLHQGDWDGWLAFRDCLSAGALMPLCSGPIAKAEPILSGVILKQPSNPPLRRRALCIGDPLAMGAPLPACHQRCDGAAAQVVCSTFPATIRDPNGGGATFARDT